MKRQAIPQLFVRLKQLYQPSPVISAAYFLRLDLEGLKFQYS
jgi:hypothetical protein